MIKETPQSEICVLFTRGRTLSASVVFFAPNPLRNERTYFDNTVCVFVALPQPPTWQKIANCPLNAPSARATDI